MPADDGLCLYLPDTEGAGMTCATMDEASRGRLFLISTPFDGPAYVLGVVPDGAGAVSRVDRTGNRATVAVSDNAYTVVGDDLARIELDNGGGYTVPRAPKLPKP